ncbi:drug/metabolite transporter [Deferribacter desulfuricans SSM1]|uniref:Drug/metabolite transporter n=1 Tax=Deferribacter desulfuricans (strain DSM 14783 / JCM 11476 / NBRC 101012 / SSM1) TaxID=639282 RepID=D3P979_DEFDS|nr:DMT family transporter [Deferribacter desulfuricans]BAI81269.1 drug/metabolite transporter [Deferribacter desulfuricans SSM1]
MHSVFFKGSLLAIISSFCFATLAIFAKIGYLKGYNTNTLLFYRFLFGTIIFLLYILIKDRNILKISKQNLLLCFIVGFVLYGLQATFFFLSVKLIGASMTSFILYMYPFTVTILAAIVYKNRIDKISVFALIIIGLGILFIFYDVINFNIPLINVSMGILAMLTFTCYLLTVQKVLTKLNYYTFTFYVLLFALFFYMVFGFNDIGTIAIKDLPFLFLLGLIPTSLGIILLYKAIQLIGSSYVSIFSSIEPFATLLISFMLFKEKIGLFQFIGGILLVFGIILPNSYRIIYERKVKRVYC